MRRLLENRPVNDHAVRLDDVDDPNGWHSKRSSVAGKANSRLSPRLDPQYHQSADIVGIDGERLFAERVCRIRLLADKSGLPMARVALESQVLGVAIGRGRALEPCALSIDELNVDCVRQMRDDRVLRLQQIGAGVSNCSAQR
jgi:hypothetical protein